MIYGYCRTAQDDDYNIRKQMDAITEHCKENNYEVEFYIDNGASGLTLDRPEMKKLLSKVKEGDTIIVSDIAMLTRNINDYEFILSRGIKVVICELIKIPKGRY